MREYRKKYYAKNRERILQQSAECRRENRERYNQYTYAWNKRNPEKTAAAASRRRAVKAKALGSHTLQEWHAVLKRFGNKCAGCGVKGKLTKDHVMPIARGGSDFAFNLQPLCAPCNSRKRCSIRTNSVSLFDKIYETA